MYALPAPARDHMVDYANCVVHRRPQAVRDLLDAATDQVRAAYVTYVLANGDAAIVQPAPAADDLRNAWRENYRLLANGGPMATMRGELISATTHGLCPLCGRGSVATLDHHLPRTHFPEFAAFGLNLVPACDDCNRAKGARWGTTSESQFLHPYYHSLPHEEILRARVTITATVVIEYEIVATPGLSQDSFNRLRYHFQVLGLAAHFRREANLELCDRKDALREVYGDAADAAAVREYLARESGSARAARGLNNWKTALLLALSRHAGFCAGGFLVL